MKESDSPPPNQWEGSWPLQAGEAVPENGVPVVYYLYSSDETLLYIGSTGQFLRRFHDHTRSKEWSRWRARECGTRQGAYLREAKEIARLRPPLNKVGARRTFNPGSASTRSEVVYVSMKARARLAKLIENALADELSSGEAKAVGMLLKRGHYWAHIGRAVCNGRRYDRATTDAVLRRGAVLFGQ